MIIDYETGIRVIRVVHEWDRNGKSITNNAFNDGGCDCECCKAARERMKEQYESQRAAIAAGDYSMFIESAPLFVLRRTATIYDDRHRELIVSALQHEIAWLKECYPGIEKGEFDEKEGVTYKSSDVENLKFAMEIIAKAFTGKEFFD